MYIPDRNFNAFGHYRLHDDSTDRHWLVRGKKNLRVTLVKTLGSG